MYSTCDPFAKNSESQEIQDIIYQSELYEACFEHDMTNGYFKDLPKRTVSDKILLDKVFILQKIQNMMDIKKVLFQRFRNFLIKSLLVVPLHTHGWRP